LLAEYGRQLDAAFIITPHACHHDQTKACLEAGLDVLLEKPMVMNAREATGLIETRNRTGRLLVVAFPGSLSPQIRTAVRLAQSGELGDLLSISATVWQNWGALAAGTWRQVPELAGGGFLFDTGAHMLNTVVDLAGQDFVEVAAWLDNCGRPVETMGVVIGRLASGAMVTLHASGETIPSCASDVHVFSKGFTHRHLGSGATQRPVTGALERYASRSLGFGSVPGRRNGSIPNSAPEVGLRMARLYDAIKISLQLALLPGFHGAGYSNITKSRKNCMIIFIR
jgi:predicted dehydrogenase